MRLKRKTVLVTAAGQGLGKASALAMAAERAKVWATDVNAQLLTSCAGVSNIHTASLEVLDKSAIQKLIADMPVIDVLFNCAGSVHVGTALDALDEERDFAFDLNLRSQCWTIQAALPRMIASGHGNITNMASVASVKGVHNRFVYSATKAAFIGLTKSVAADFFWARHLLQRYLSWDGRHAITWRLDQCVRRPRRCTQKLHRMPADGLAGAGL